MIKETVEVSKHSNKPEISTKVSSQMINIMEKEPSNKQIILIQVILRMDYLMETELSDTKMEKLSLENSEQVKKY